MIETIQYWHHKKTMSVVENIVFYNTINNL